MPTQRGVVPRGAAAPGHPRAPTPGSAGPAGREPAGQWHGWHTAHTGNCSGNLTLLIGDEGCAPRRKAGSEPGPGCRHCPLAPRLEKGLGTSSPMRMEAAWLYEPTASFCIGFLQSSSQMGRGNRQQKLARRVFILKSPNHLPEGRT